MDRFVFELQIIVALKGFFFGKHFCCTSWMVDFVCIDCIYGHIISVGLLLLLLSAYFFILEDRPSTYLICL